MRLYGGWSLSVHVVDAPIGGAQHFAVCGNARVAVWVRGAGCVDKEVMPKGGKHASLK